MTFRDWVHESRTTIESHGWRLGGQLAALEFGLGIARRADWLVPDGTTIWDQDDWDIVCILDACRLDLMQNTLDDYDWLPDTCGRVWSPGSCSPEWMDATFNRDKWREEMATTGYITANPFSAKPHDRLELVTNNSLPLADSDFAYFDEVWRDHWQNDPISTVPPRPLTDAAIRAWRQREQLEMDRLVVHYMQPHIPFRSRPDWFGVRDELAEFGEPDKEGGTDPWLRVRDGDLPREAFWQAYRDNLDWVLDDINMLRQNCDAAVVLTSDHGNGFGEWGVFSHPGQTPLPVLRQVPWVRVPAVDRGTYEPDRNVEGDVTSSIDDRLAALGYR